MNAEIDISNSADQGGQPAWRYWVEPIGLLSLYLLNELLPVVFGTGEHAKWDWAMLYVTLRGILLPLGAVAAIVLNIVRVVRRQRKLSFVLIAQLIACAMIVILCWFYQGGLFLHKP